MTDRFGGRLNELYSNSVSHFFARLAKYVADKTNLIVTPVSSRRAAFCLGMV